MGQAGIHILCYNFMPPRLRVARTTYEVPIRGGALSSEFRSGPGEAWDDSIRTIDGETTHEAMRENFRYFLKEVIPTAEEAGVYLACHPGASVAPLSSEPRIYIYVLLHRSVR